MVERTIIIFVILFIGMVIGGIIARNISFDEYAWYDQNLERLNKEIAFWKETYNNLSNYMIKLKLSVKEFKKLTQEERHQLEMYKSYVINSEKGNRRLREENSQLKESNKRYKEKLDSKDFAISVFINMKNKYKEELDRMNTINQNLTAERDELEEELHSWQNAYNDVENSHINLYNENKELKEKLEKIKTLYNKHFSNKVVKCMTCSYYLAPSDFEPCIRCNKMRTKENEYPCWRKVLPPNDTESHTLKIKDVSDKWFGEKVIIIDKHKLHSTNDIVKIEDLPKYDNYIIDGFKISQNDYPVIYVKEEE